MRQRAVEFAENIPQHLIDTRDRAHADRPAAVKAGVVHHLPEVFDMTRIFADEIVSEFVHGGGDRMCAAFDDRLAPARDALVRFDLEEAPARRNDEGFEFGDFHAMSPDRNAHTSRVTELVCIVLLIVLFTGISRLPEPGYSINAESIQETVIHRDLHGRVAYELGTAILRGDFLPQAPLPREAELMERFGVSRTVLREALRTLTSKGLIESRPKVGTRVRTREAWNLLDGDMLEWYSRVAAPMHFALKL